MRPIELDVDLDSVDADGLAAINDSSGSSLTLDGVLTSGGTFTAADGLARQLSIKDTATQDQSDSTFTITGTDENGDTQTEVVTGPTAGATVESAKYFKTVSSIAIAGGDAGDTVDVGTVDEIATQHVVLNHRAQTAATVSVDVTGTVNFTVQETFDNVLAGNTPAWSNVTALASKSADTTAQVSVNATAVRLIVNSHSAAAELQMIVLQSDR